MKAILIIICLSLFSSKVVSQTNEIVNPKGKWFLGAEMGTNKRNSFMDGESKISFQGGFLIEYYFARQWSLSSKVKYFETGVSFFQSGSDGGWFGFESDRYSGVFEGAVITIPFCVKWEFRIYKNLRTNLKVGYTLNIETKSNYYNYSNNLSTDYPKQYGSVNPGVGFNYYMNKKISMYFDVESYSGSGKGYAVNIFGKRTYYLDNVLMSFGIKYNLNNNKNENN